VALLVRTGVSLPYVIRTPNRDFACGLHLVPRRDGAVYVGATNRVWSVPPARDGAMLGELHFLLDGALRELHVDLRFAHLERALVGWRPIAVDRVPLVGQTRTEGLLIATGTYRNGVLMAPLISEIVADLVQHGRTERTHPFSPLARSTTTAPDKPAARLLETNARDLVESLLEPGGHLPYDRLEELADFVAALGRMALEDGPDARQLREGARHLLETYPLAEMVPELYLELAAARLAPPPDAGPT
jgi:hypothetical protein